MTEIRKAKTPQAEHDILVVDDDPAITRLLSATLTQLGYGAAVTHNIKEARERLRCGQYSLILCDHDMPGGTGLDLLNYVSRVHPHLPFIMLTGRIEKSLAQDAISHGALDFIGKPIDRTVLERVLIQNWARLKHNRQATTRATDHVLRGTLRAMVRAIDAKDPYTAAHSERVTKLAIRLGEAEGLDEEASRLLEYAALLHDVGKIGVPDHVLRKPGPLDESEWLLIREHPVRSAEIIIEVSELAEVATLARHHHERLDGTGYPDGLRGDGIPYLSQILAIADVYEALTSERAYRAAMPPEAARSTLRQGWGTHFNPHLGELFDRLEGLP